MKTIRLLAALAGCVLFHSAFADVYLVETNPNAAAPYDTWATAATSYSDAIGQLTSGNTLWISNGTYSATAFTPPANTTIRSVNGSSARRSTMPANHWASRSRTLGRRSRACASIGRSTTTTAA